MAASGESPAGGTRLLPTRNSPHFLLRTRSAPYDKVDGKELNTCLGDLVRPSRDAGFSFSC